MKLLNKKLIEYFGTDELTEEFVKNYTLKANEAMLLNGKVDNMEQINAIINELNAVQRNCPELRVNIAFLNIQSTEQITQIVSALDGKNINSLTLNGNFENINLQDLKKYDNLKSLLLLNENGKNNELTNIALPESLLSFHTMGLHVTPQQIDKLLQDAEQDNSNEKKEISITLNNISELPLEKLNELEKHYNIKNIRNTSI